MQVTIDPRVDRQLRLLPLSDSARIAGVIELFKRNGFSLTVTHLKKLRTGLWELRVGGWRLLFGRIDIAIKRLEEYL